MEYIVQEFDLLYTFFYMDFRMDMDVSNNMLWHKLIQKLKLNGITTSYILAIIRANVRECVCVCVAYIE